MPEQRIYQAPGIDLAHFGQALAQWFESQNMETQVLGGSPNVITIQARQPKDWKAYVAGSVALSVMATLQGSQLTVQMGSAKWADKVAGGVVAMILFWPLAAFPAWGALKQKQIIDEAESWIQRYVASGGGSAPVDTQPFSLQSAPAGAGGVACPSCGAQVAAGNKFCGSCGAKMDEELVCAQCGAKLNPGAKFCENCGAKTGA
jgi:hypothetical protein